MLHALLPRYTHTYNTSFFKPKVKITLQLKTLCFSEGIEVNFLLKLKKEVEYNTIVGDNFVINSVFASCISLAIIFSKYSSHFDFTARLYLNLYFTMFI